MATDNTLMPVFSECEELYQEKNKRYQNSFAKQFHKKGLPLSLMRIEDKYLRFEYLVTNPQDDGGDESIEDTLKDLINYSAMTLKELYSMKEGGTIDGD